MIKKLSHLTYVSYEKLYEIANSYHMVVKNADLEISLKI